MTLHGASRKLNSLPEHVLFLLLFSQLGKNKWAIVKLLITSMVVAPLIGIMLMVLQDPY